MCVFAFPARSCEQYEQKCDDGIKCILVENVCNGYNDCSDGSDEDEKCRGK